MHIEQVLGDVAKDKRCLCHQKGESKDEKEKGNQAAAAWARRIFG
jgi:hypothetical protein